MAQVLGREKNAGISLLGSGFQELDTPSSLFLRGQVIEELAEGYSLYFIMIANCVLVRHPSRGFEVPEALGGTEGHVAVVPLKPVGGPSR